MIMLLPLRNSLFFLKKIQRIQMQIIILFFCGEGKSEFKFFLTILLSICFVKIIFVNLFLLLFISSTALFDNVYESYCTISAYSYLYL